MDAAQRRERDGILPPADQPRRRARQPGRDLRAAIVLAAGASRRFGREDKLLALLHGSPLLHHAIAAARAARPSRILVVVAHPRVARSLRNVRVVHARDARIGLSASLAAGLRALRPIEREVLIFLGDMPFARAPRRLRLPSGAAAARPMVAGRPGHPLLVRVAAARAARARGDRGLSGLAPVASLPGSAANLLDVDSRRALRAARLGSPRRRPR